MERKQFTFYISFFKAIQHIRSKAARADAYDAICAYAFHETVPDLDRLPPPAAMAFEAAQPVLDAGRRKAQSGAAGGAARSAGSTAEAADKQEKEQDQDQYQYQYKEQTFYSPAWRGGGKRRKPLWGSAGTAPIGEEERAAVERMLQGVKRNA